jgi:hypothetical protein
MRGPRKLWWKKFRLRRHQDQVDVPLASDDNKQSRSSHRAIIRFHACLLSFKAKSLLAWPLSALPETSCKFVFKEATGGEIQPVAFSFF